MKHITFKGKPLTLVGREVKEKRSTPDFHVTGNDLEEVSLSSFSDKIKVITSFPSLDTPVCDLQVKEFNSHAASLVEDVVVVGISKDLPFAQKRFCDAHNIKNVSLFSDYKDSSFGINYGLLIKELSLLARSVWVIDRSNVVRYRSIVAELTHAPDYKGALAALAEVAKSPRLALEESLPSRCTPCERGTLPLPKERVETLLAQHRGWQLVDEKKLRKEFVYKDFVEAKYFVDIVASISQEQGHHPTITLVYNKVKVALTTHAVGGLTENDFIMAVGPGG